MRKGKIDRLCEEYNNKMGLKYPQPGCLVHMDITGWGDNHRKLHIVVSTSGDLCCIHSCRNTRDAVTMLEKKIAAINT